jgi:hypothetical protein
LHFKIQIGLLKISSTRSSIGDVTNRIRVRSKKVLSSLHVPSFLLASTSRQAPRQASRQAPRQRYNSCNYTHPKALRSITKFTLKMANESGAHNTIEEGSGITTPPESQPPLLKANPSTDRFLTCKYLKDGGELGAGL